MIDDKNKQTQINELLITHIRNMSHTMRSLYEGKGSQKRILIILSQSKQMTQQTLTEKLGIKPSSVSEVLAKLENAQLISRSPSQVDRRTTDIALTAQGKALAMEALEQRNKRHDEMFSCLSEDEKKQFLTFLKKINDDWKKYDQVLSKKKNHHKSRNG